MNIDRSQNIGAVYPHPARLYIEAETTLRVPGICSLETQTLSAKGKTIQAQVQYFSYADIKRYRKEVACALSKPELSEVDLEALQQTHQEISALLNTHLLFRIMKPLSVALKNQAAHQNLTEVERRLLHQFEYFQHTAIVSTSAERRLIRKQIWDTYKKTMFLPKRRITWIHGSTSSALPIIIRVQRALHLPAPALIPTGILLRHHFAPLSGELYWGSSTGGINQNCLSGMDLSGFSIALSYSSLPHISRTVATIEKSLQEILTHPEAVATFGPYRTGLCPLKIKVLQFLHLRPASLLLEEVQKGVALFQESVKRLLDQNPLNLWGGYLSKHNRALANTTPCRPFNPTEVLKNGELVVLQESARKIFGMIANTIPQPHKRMILLEPDGLGIEAAFADIHVPTLTLPYQPCPTFIEYKEQLHAEFEEIKQLLHTIRPPGITKEEMEELIQPAFPIVWASYSLHPETFKRGVMGEKIVRTEAAFLGRDIQIAFTDEAHQEMLQKYIQPYNVTVASLDTGALLSALPELQTIPIEQIRAATPSGYAETEPDDET